MYALAVRPLPEGDWLYEIKLDGYRCLAGRDADGVKLWSRRGNELTSQFPTIANAFKKLPSGTLIDGEIVAMDANRQISFNLLQHHRSQASAIWFFCFDVLIRSGKSILQLPLIKRRDSLDDMLRQVRKDSYAVDVSQILVAGPSEIIRTVSEFGLEGIIAKRPNSIYEPGRRSGAWLKYKIKQGQEFS